MVFDGDANNMDICTLADSPNKTNDTSFPLWKKAMFANMGMRAIWREIFDTYGGWQLFDKNLASGSERIATNTVSGTQFYQFAAADWIIGADWVDENGNEFPLTPITLEEIRDRGYAEDEFFDTPGSPQYYRLVDDGIKLYPAPDSSVTSGVLVHVGAQDISPFTPSTTSTEPGFDELAGHEAVAEFMAFKYSDDNDKSNRDKREVAWLRALASIKSHYKKKFMERKPAMRNRPMGSAFVDGLV